MNYRDIKMLLLHAEFQLRKFEFEFIQRFPLKWENADT